MCALNADITRARVPPPSVGLSSSCHLQETPPFPPGDPRKEVSRQAPQVSSPGISLTISYKKGHGCGRAGRAQWSLSGLKMLEDQPFLVPKQGQREEGGAACCAGGRRGISYCSNRSSETGKAAGTVGTCREEMPAPRGREEHLLPCKDRAREAR